MSGEHLITDDETRRIAEGFLAVSSWLGDVEWGRTSVGPAPECLEAWGDEMPDDKELADSLQWSWTVSFTDPAGRLGTLDHERVLEGLTRLVYGEHTGSEGWRALAIQQWFTEPAADRRGLALSTADQSLICQHALYAKTVFPTGDADALFGKKLDIFAEQRPGAAPAES